MLEDVDDGLVGADHGQQVSTEDARAHGVRVLLRNNGLQRTTRVVGAHLGWLVRFLAIRPINND